MGGLAVSFLLALAGPPSPPSACLIDKPVWSQRPGDLSQPIYYPTTVENPSGVDGHTVVDCVVNAQGRLAGCTLIKEDPVGYHHGERALRVANKFVLDIRATPRPPGGSFVGCHVRIPITWRYN